MRTLSIRLAALVCLSVMFGCATAGVNFSSEGVKRLSIGSTTEKEVIEAFGEPFKRQTRSEKNIQYQLLIYTYARGTANGAKGRTLEVEFTNGVLNGYLFSSAFKDDSTDFNIDAVSKLNEKPLTLNDVVSLIGRPHGEVRLPSILLEKTFGPMPEAVPPSEASRAVIYLYAEAERESKLLNTHMKLCIVYTTADGSVIETRYFKGTL